MLTKPALLIHDWRGYAKTENFRTFAVIDHPTLPATPDKEVSEKDLAEAVEALKAPTTVDVTGVSLRVAERIVAGRPYRAVEDLLKIKGVGEKLLNSLKMHIKAS